MWDVKIGSEIATEIQRQHNGDTDPPNWVGGGFEGGVLE